VEVAAQVVAGPAGLVELLAGGQRGEFCRGAVTVPRAVQQLSERRVERLSESPQSESAAGRGGRAAARSGGFWDTAARRCGVDDGK